MANSAINILNIIIFFVLISQGYSQCSLNDLHVTQSITGVTVHEKQEWKVTITNWCPCVQKNVMLNCMGFQSTKQVDPSLLTVSHGVCLVNAGKPIGKDAIEFNYAWDPPFPLNPISSNISCS
ncbi:hypothetical protein E2542_SST28935 [Spatholobus suberectus]|nr:hypothetical protein E2542_SST28935 [Spatholobus suberectus]